MCPFLKILILTYEPSGESEYPEKSQSAACLSLSLLLFFLKAEASRILEKNILHYDVRL